METPKIILVTHCIVIFLVDFFTLLLMSNLCLVNSFLLVKVHKKLGNTHLALMHFSWATDLDPKGANSQIKEAIDPAMSRSQAEEDTSTTHPGL
jgi:hypothetical protein